MDVATTALAMVSARSASTAQALTAKFLKDNAASAEAVVGLIEASTQNLQKIAAEVAGHGGLIDVTV